VPSPLQWGTEAGLRELFGVGIASLQVAQRSIAQRYTSAQPCVEHLRTNFGPVVAAFATLDAERQARLMRAMVEEAQRFNRSGDEPFVVPCDYLEVVAVKR
jgi:hypothetical protein